MYAILELSGQEYVDRYAADVKAELEPAKKFPRRQTLRANLRSANTLGPAPAGPLACHP